MRNRLARSVTFALGALFWVGTGTAGWVYAERSHLHDGWVTVYDDEAGHVEIETASLMRAPDGFGRATVAIVSTTDDTLDDGRTYRAERWTSEYDCPSRFRPTFVVLYDSTGKEVGNRSGPMEWVTAYPGSTAAIHTAAVCQRLNHSRVRRWMEP